MSGIRRCACACGAQIAAHAGGEAAAVRRHQASERHALWRQMGGLEAVDPMAQDRALLAWLVQREWLARRAA